ncbi:perlucin-like isoform X2 [Mizuhopecten yessoensis]|uniref:Perlucin n=1 Tax=Mizuhopecten yessoensis TaxID=6573 RepID=A0A210QWY9_MIZYE|nr:perlucin-like isoform X2 [Mizuhopecten yessoensis]OWF53231.1 Perlucin [Mizuhopecten yessoensis]
MARFSQFVFTLLSLSIQTVFGCPSGWLSHNDKCYFLSSFKASWPAAESYCRTFHAKLAEPMDRSSINFLSGEVKGSPPLTGTDYFLGGGDLFVEGEWIWMSTQALISATNWAPGEPNDGGHHEDCLVIYPSAGLWNDATCSDQKGFICEMEAEMAGSLIG